MEKLNDIQNKFQMALSKAVIPYTIQDEQVTAQHFLICCTEDCENSCQFYCNPCYKPMCEECRDKHQKTPETKYHEVVPYRDRRQKLPVEKCKDHPSKDIDIICENCQVPLCSKCAIRNHWGHKLDDLETVYSDRFTIFVNKICDIHQCLLPISQNMQKDIKEDTKEIKEIMDKIRTSIKIEAEYLKQLTDMVMTDILEQVKKIEQSLIKELQRQDKNYENYNNYLEDLIKDIHGYLSFDKVTNNPIIFSLSEHLKTKPIPETTKPVYPVFTAGQNSKDDVANLFGRITAPNTKPEKRKIKSIETASAQLKFEEKQKQFEREKFDVKQALLPSCSVTKVRQYTVPGVERVYHISVGQSGRLWASDNSGKLIQTDLQGRYLQILASCGSGCYHTVTLDDDLIYTDKKKNVINRIALDYSITKFITIGDLEPISIHSSHINEDVLVGIRKYGEGQVTRYNKKGKEIQKTFRETMKDRNSIVKIHTTSQKTSTVMSVCQT